MFLIGLLAGKGRGSNFLLPTVKKVWAVSRLLNAGYCYHSINTEICKLMATPEKKTDAYNNKLKITDLKLFNYG